MSDNIFISEKNPISNRWVVFEEDGITGWLYLTEPNSEKIVADCWIYNQIIPPAFNDVYKSEDRPPPAIIKYIAPNASNVIYNEDIRFKWSQSGDDVAIILNNIPTGYIIGNNKRGFCRNLLKDGPWGNIFSESIYSKTFEY